MQRAECERDRLLVSALAKRYPADPTAEAIKAADVAYGEAMLAVAQQFPHDVTALVVAADAFMVQAPWNWWNLTTAVTGEGKKAGEGATALVDNLAPAKPLLAAVLAIDTSVERSVASASEISPSWFVLLVRLSNTLRSCSASM